MSQSAEYRVRQALNLIGLTERCLELAGTTPAERVQLLAELERAKKDLRSISQGPDLPDELVGAVASICGATAPAAPVAPAASPAVHALPLDASRGRAFRRNGDRHGLQPQQR